MQSQHFTPPPPHFQSGCMIVGGVGEGHMLQCLLEYYCEKMYLKIQVGYLSYSAKLHVLILCFLNHQPVIYGTCTHSESFLCQKKASSIICKGHVVMEEIRQKFIDDLYQAECNNYSLHVYIPKIQVSVFGICWNSTQEGMNWLFGHSCLCGASHSCLWPAHSPTRSE